MTTEEIIAALEDKGRATVKEIGADNPTMYKLEKAGVVVKTDETRRSGGRGRPAVVWTLGDKSKAAEVPKPGKKKDKRDMSAAHKGKRKKREQREKEELKRKKEELKRLKKEIPTLMPQYEEALAKALKKDVAGLWKQAEQLQNSIIGGNRRIKTLESELS
jgi:predicted ArsR family transcriptional regulator